MRKTMFISAAALLVLVICVFPSGPVQAEPPNHPDKCGPFTGDIFACRGHLICTNDGEYMCCVKSDSGGESCDKVETTTVNPKGRLGALPGGPLKNAPLAPSPDTGTVRQPVLPGMKAPIMRRGIEGDQPAEPSPGTPTAPEQPSGTK